MEDLVTTLKLGKSIVRNLALSNGRFAALYRQRQGEHGYNPNKDQAEYPLEVFRHHARVLLPLRADGFLDAEVMEIGPGGNVGASFLMLLAGARRAVCIDVVPWIRGVGPDALYLDLITAAIQDPQTYHAAPTLLQRAREDAAGLARDLLRRVTYLYPMNIETAALPDASLDLIFSHACFEHFPHPGVAIAQIARLLRPAGISSHQIDLRDHRDFTKPLHFLRYSDSIWNLAMSRWPNGVRNRWRVSEYQAAFEQHGFEVTHLEATLEIGVTEAMRRQFHPHFQAMSLESLGFLGLLIAGRKH